MVNWKFSIVGAVLVVAFGIIGGIIEHGVFLGVIISGIIVGYLVNNGYKNGAVNGLIAGFIGGLILGIVDSYFFIIFNNLGKYIVWVLLSGVFFAIFSAIGGIVGSLIKGKHIENRANNPFE